MSRLAGNFPLKTITATESSLHANRIVEVAALTTDDEYFKDFMIIEMNYLENSSEGPPFTIEVRLTIATFTGAGKEKTREQRFSTDLQFV